MGQLPVPTGGEKRITAAHFDRLTAPSLELTKNFERISEDMSLGRAKGSLGVIRSGFFAISVLFCLTAKMLVLEPFAPLLRVFITCSTIVRRELNIVGGIAEPPYSEVCYGRLLSMWLTRG